MGAGRLPGVVVVAYGLPGLVVALPVLPVAVLLPEHYAVDRGLTLAVTGLALGAARLLDFFADLPVGVLVDRGRWRGLRYKHWMVAGALAAGLGLVQLAWPPVPVTAAHLALWSLVLFLGWTLLVIPYTAWGAELGRDSGSRAALAASREVAGLLGMLLALLLPLFAATGLPALAPVAVAAVVLGAPALALALLVVPEPSGDGSSDRVDVRTALAVLRVPAVRGLLGCWFFNGVANGLPATLFPLVVEQHFGGDAGAVERLLACYFGAAVLGAPAWLALARRVGPARAWQAANVAAVTVFAPVPFLAAGALDWFTLVCVLSGATLGADLVLPPTLQAGVLAGDRHCSGQRRTATAFALWSMAGKLALAVAVACGFGVLGAAGTADDPAASTTVLLLTYAGVPLALKILVCVLVARWRHRSATLGV